MIQKTIVNSGINKRKEKTQAILKSISLKKIREN